MDEKVYNYGCGCQPNGSTKVCIFGAPGRYIQGKGAIMRLGEYLKPLGSRALVAGGALGLSETREGREKSLREHGIRQFEEIFGGETCEAEIARLVKVGKNVGCDIMLASGGGKVIDTVKAAAQALEVPAVIVPTIASNDAPCSALSVIYNEDGSFARIEILKNSPSLVLTDTEIIARAPVRQLVSGMGDALATWFEAEACHKSGALNNFGGHISMTALAIARLCYDTLMSCGREAKRSCEEKTVTHELERVIEANVLLSGLGFESGGVAAAHALSESFSNIPGLHGVTHGEKVAFGLIAHLILDGCPEDVLLTVLKFCKDVGLPVTVSELGIESVADLEFCEAVYGAAAPGSVAHNLREGLTGEEIYKAVIRADELGRSVER